LGYVALTRQEFNQRIAILHLSNRVGTNILMMTIISFLVGLSISGQTFYTFILENLDVRRPQGHWGQESGAGLHDPVHGNVYGHDRLRVGHRPGDPDDRHCGPTCPTMPPSSRSGILAWRLGWCC
jgi:hypothetical protein